MSGIVSKAAPVFRRSFKVPNTDAVRWFPGHMDKGLKQMEGVLKDVDCVIEVHDARVPLSGRNADFRHLVLGTKPHLLVLNKKDLADLRHQQSISERLQKEYGITDVVFTNCRDDQDTTVGSIVPKAVDLVQTSPRYNREGSTELNLMIIGVPNVGKSSLINRLRNKLMHRKNANPVGAKPGITRAMMTRIKVQEDPPIFLFDTPGILSPSVKNVESGLRLALCACLHDHLVGEEVIADYLLYWLNSQGNFSYVELMGLEGPTDNIGTVLTKGAMKLKKFEKRLSHQGYVNRPHLSAAALFFIRSFREGKLGPVQLDMDLLNQTD